MKRFMRTLFAFGAAGVALACFAPSAYADGVDLSVGDVIRLYDGIGNGNGGEFNGRLQQYNGGGTTNSSSYTEASPNVRWSGFCVETNEYFSNGEAMRINAISGRAYGGGAGGQEPPSGDPISSQTAWLFTQFWNSPGSFAGVTGAGTAASGVYNASTAAEANNAYWLQRAIWYFEDEGGSYRYGTGANSAVENYYVTLANTAIANGYTGIGAVRVLNLVSLNGAVRQDQLVLLSNPPPITIVPEPASIALLGIGLAAGACLRRRRLTIVSRG